MDQAFKVYGGKLCNVAANFHIVTSDWINANDASLKCAGLCFDPTIQDVESATKLVAVL